MVEPMPVLDMRIFTMHDLRTASGGNRAVAEIIDVWRERGRTAWISVYEEALWYFRDVFDTVNDHEIAALQRTLSLCGMPFANGVQLLDVLDVDDEGRGPKGEDYELRGSPEAIAQGLIVEHPVLLRHPDGRIEKSVELRFTPTGMMRLKSSLDDERAGLTVAPVGRAH